MRLRILVLASIAFVIETHAGSPPSRAMVAWRTPDGMSLVRRLGTQAVGGNVDRLAALVELPTGVDPRSLGLEPVAPGIARLRGTPAEVLAWGDAHPTLRTEVGPPLHLLLDRAGNYVTTTSARSAFGLDGSGTLVGIADTGLDVRHPNFVDDQQHSRVAWMLDLSLAPLGKHPELEEKYGLKDDKGVVVRGAVLSGADIDAMVQKGDEVPTDKSGHGTHVAGIAAGDPRGGSKFIGMAPKAKLVIARVTRDDAGTIFNDDSLMGAQFIFDRADEMMLPVVANFSIGTDFGPHDGTTLWEKTLATYVGPDHPGHAIVVAAGNSGSIAQTPIHQSVLVTQGSTVSVPIQTHGAKDGNVQVWVTKRPGAKMDIGLDGPDGTWIAPVSEGEEAGHNQDKYQSGVIHGRTKNNPSTVPEGSSGAIVLWAGSWPPGQYAITLRGEGMADLWVQGLGSGDINGDTPVTFEVGIREGTINLPATHPSLIAVGCTVNKTSWKALAGETVGITKPQLDETGTLPGPDDRVKLEEGEICYFSSSGPTAVGVPKPDIAAPGGVVVSAMSQQALPGSPGTVFNANGCPKAPGTDHPDPACLQVDKYHAVQLGTSMASPMVAGTIALLFQKDRTLTQDVLRALLQSGAHVIRGSAPFHDQSSVGELDAIGAVYALDQMKASPPSAYLPEKTNSWLHPSADYAAADGSTPLTVFLELRTGEEALADQHRATLFDSARLRADIRIGGVPFDGPPVVPGGAPGLFTYTLSVPRGHGGESLVVGATFDGAPIVEPVTLPIAVDPFSAIHAASSAGGCNTAPGTAGLPWWLALVALRRRRRDPLFS